MKLERDLTGITIVERVEHAQTFMSEASQASVAWEAELDGQTEAGEQVQMSRIGRTPDEALKNLFEAMGDAGLTL